MKQRKEVTKTVINTLKKSDQMYPSLYLARIAGTTVQSVYNIVHVLYKADYLIKVKEDNITYYQWID